MSIIIGIDPGSRVTGYGIIECDKKSLRYLASGVIQTDTSQSMPQRLQTIFFSLQEIIQTYSPHQACIESVFCHKNPETALKLGQARGAAMAAVAGISVAEYTPRAVKLAVVGYGQAEKAQVQHMVLKRLNLTGKLQTDAADALAVALCHTQHDNPLFALLSGHKGKRYD